MVTREFEQNGLAYLMLGQMYQHGKYVGKDFEKAMACYQKAWEQGYVLALTYLGKLEQEKGHHVKGWLYRLKAGFVGIPIVLKNSHDSRLRSS